MTRWAPFIMMLVADVFPGGCCGGTRYQPPPPRAVPESVQGAVMAYATVTPGFYGATAVTGRCVDTSICETQVVGNSVLIFGKKAGVTDVIVGFGRSYDHAPHEELPVHVTIVEAFTRLPPLELGAERRGAPFTLAAVKVGAAPPRDYACYPGTGGTYLNGYDPGDVVRGDVELARCNPPRDLAPGATYHPFAPGPVDDSLELCLHRTTRGSVLLSMSVYQTTKEGHATLIERRGPAGEVCSMKPGAR